MTILKGLRVLEISANGSAAWASKHLADFGAEVTILEPAEGTPLRTFPPYFEKDGNRKSATWEWLSRGKTSVRVNGKFTQEAARALCEAADVTLIESEMADSVLGLKPSELRDRFKDRTTFVLISPFATDGPYAAYSATDLGIDALSGWGSAVGDPKREPVRPAAEMLFRVSGIAAVVATLIALRHVRRGGQPQFVDVSNQAVAASMIVQQWILRSMFGIKPVRVGNRWPQGVMECADGWLGCSPLTPTHWELMCHMMGIADVLEEPGGREPAYRAEHSEELYERVKPWLKRRTRMQIFEEAQAWRIPSAPVEDIQERLNDPQLNARGFFLPTEIEGKVVKTPRVPYKIRGIEPVTRGPLRETEMVESLSSTATYADGRATAPPFQGIRVLDLTTFWSGPYCTMLLGTLGADVIKIESIQRPDPFRYTGAPSALDRFYERGPIWHDSNCDKRGLTLDLTQPEGKALFLEMAKDADVVISNFSNRVMPNFGLTPERLLQHNPRLIVVEMPGYGPGGPWENYVGYGVAFEQLAAVASINGYPDDAPQYMGGFCDPTVGFHTFTAIELALRQREETGRGVAVEVCQCETLDSLFGPEHIAVQHGAPVPTRQANKHAWMAPHDAYRVQGDDRWITIAVASDEEFSALAKTIGVPELTSDSRFATVAARKQNEKDLDTAIASALKDRDGRELERELQAAGIKACRIVHGYEIDTEDNLAHMGFFQTLERPVTGAHPYKTWPFRFPAIDTKHKLPPPLLGQHNNEVLTSLLGLSLEDLKRLEEKGIIGSEPAALGIAG